MKFDRYWEPFLGGGSLFYLLRPTNAVLSDACGPLMDTYRAVRQFAPHILEQLKGLAVDRQTYYRIRDRTKMTASEAAADFIYVNKTCWNGLFRVNSRGEFNVPFGLPKTSSVVDEVNLLECAKLLQQPGIEIRTADFEDVLDGVETGDLVFLDPPYVTSHNDNGFVDYNEVLFSWADQERLARVAQALRQRGVSVVVTNADHAELLALYRGFAIEKLHRNSTIAARSASRRPVTEALIYSVSHLERAHDKQISGRPRRENRQSGDTDGPLDSTSSRSAEAESREPSTPL